MKYDGIKIKATDDVRMAIINGIDLVLLETFCRRSMSFSRSLGRQYRHRNSCFSESIITGLNRFLNEWHFIKNSSGGFSFMAYRPLTSLITICHGSYVILGL